MKILFLDHQGVVYLKNHPSPGDFDDFDKKAVIILNEILDSVPDLQIVVSSDWKRWGPFDKLQEFYKKQDIHRIPIDVTPWFGKQYKGSYQKQRGEEINEWLSNHPNVTHWVAVDDLDLLPYVDHFVRTDYHKGILEPGIQKQILSYFIKQGP